MMILFFFFSVRDKNPHFPWICTVYKQHAVSVAKETSEAAAFLCEAKFPFNLS